MIAHLPDGHSRFSRFLIESLGKISSRGRLKFQHDGAVDWGI